MNLALVVVASVLLPFLTTLLTFFLVPWTYSNPFAAAVSGWFGIFMWGCVCTEVLSRISSTSSADDSSIHWYKSVGGAYSILGLLTGCLVYFFGSNDVGLSLIVYFVPWLYGTKLRGGKFFWLYSNRLDPQGTTEQRTTHALSLLERLGVKYERLHARYRTSKGQSVLRIVYLVLGVAFGTYAFLSLIHI